MRVTIIGANGYLGSHLADNFVKKNWTVFGYGTKESCPVSGLEYSQINLKNKEDVAKIRLDVDFVFYFAAITGTLDGYTRFEDYLDVNQKALIYLLNEMKELDSKARLIFPSTRLIYKGIQNTPLNEESEKEFKTVYALTKWFGEQIINQYSKYFNLSYTIFRICVPYDNLLDTKASYGTLGFFLSQARNYKDITVYGEGDAKRTFSSIGDIVNQIYTSILKKESLNNTYNIGGTTYSLFEVAEMVAKKYGVNVIKTPWPELSLKTESGDTVFDSSKIENLIGSTSYKRITEWLRAIDL